MRSPAFQLDIPHLSPRSRYYWPSIISELRKHPNKWTVVLETENSNTAGVYAYRLREGRMGNVPAGAVEAHSQTKDGLTRVWARYLG